uniref:Reverse transcriptase domain-containing protein n=1 Tax=Graphocephala atropunctata TaxID=36148 RepID=A0A1B6MU01_9HEMI
MVLTKLEYLGFRETALSWFTSYLSDRDQLVELKQSTRGVRVLHRSDRLPVNRGVPQGSVLGPVLFVLFTSDFPVYMEPYSNTIIYADDMVLLISGKNREALEVQSYIALNVAIEYCAANDLVYNESKRKEMTLGSMKDELSGFPNLDSVHAVEHLGVVVDNKISWMDHVDKLCAKLSSALFAIRRVKHVSTEDAVRTAYSSLFECHLRYGIVLWGATTNGYLERVLITQKKAVRMLADLDWRASCRGAFKELGILTVTNIYLLEVICLASSRQLQRNMDTHTYQTRNARDFALPIHHSRRFQSKHSYGGAKFFNVLPETIKRADPVTLKKKLRSWLLQQPFYTISEFLDWQNFTV